MASTPSSFQTGNHLLDLLPPGNPKPVSGLVQPVTFKLRQVLYSVRGPIDYVYFPSSGIISAMTVMEDGRAIEVATIGKEGMAGLTTLVGGETSPYEVMVQVPGEGWRMRTTVFQEEVRKVDGWRKIFVLYHTAFAMQVSYAVACNGLHTIEQRCCRWLLMTHDRVGSESLPLTHEFLAIMLGVRRASVTDVLHPLQKRGLIRNGRGRIEIIDRAGMEAHACECYQAINAEFTRVFGPSPPRRWEN